MKRNHIILVVVVVLGLFGAYYIMKQQGIVGSIEEKVLALAQKEVGVKEDLGTDLDSGGRIMTYLKDTGWTLKKSAGYCFAFCGYVWNQAFGKQYWDTATPYVAEAAARRWNTWKELREAFYNGYRVQPGDIMLSDERSSGTSTHAGLVTKAEYKDGKLVKLYLIEANYSNSVKETTRTGSDIQVIRGFIPLSSSYTRSLS